MQKEPPQTIRLDKWLKITRIIKTRTHAMRACEQRQVKVNDRVAKPSKMVKIGDTVTVKKGNRYRTFDVVGISHRSISAKEARELYREHFPEVSKETQKIMEYFLKIDRKLRPRYKGRPTKRQRRQLEKLRGY